MAMSLRLTVERPHKVSCNHPFSPHIGKRQGIWIVQPPLAPKYLSRLFPLLLSCELGFDRVSIWSVDDHLYRSSSLQSACPNSSSELANTSRLALNNRVTLFRYPSGATISSSLTSVSLYLLIFSFADSTRLIFLSGRPCSNSTPLGTFIILFPVLAIKRGKVPVPFTTASRVSPLPSHRYIFPLGPPDMTLFPHFS